MADFQYPFPKKVKLLRIAQKYCFQKYISAVWNYTVELLYNCINFCEAVGASKAIEIQKRRRRGVLTGRN